MTSDNHWQYFSFAAWKYFPVHLLYKEYAKQHVNFSPISLHKTSNSQLIMVTNLIHDVKKKRCIYILFRISI